MAHYVLFGGTFNPFHIGHYEMLSVLNGLPDADGVFLMPDRIPPHKDSSALAPDEDRIAMCRLAAEDFDRTRLCLIEFERAGKSYTFDTVQELKKRFPGDRFSMACGGDMIASLDQWYRWRELIGEIGFYAFRRVGASDFDRKVERFRKEGAAITVLRNPVTKVSSTELRALLKQGKKTDLLPEKIGKYIEERNLYCGNRDSEC